MINLFNARVTYCSVSRVGITISVKFEELKGKGYSPYFIQDGGHGNIRTQAYVDVHEEIMDYEKMTIPVLIIYTMPQGQEQHRQD